jgi:DNA-binding SARP family transcriptional activator
MSSTRTRIGLTAALARLVDLTGRIIRGLLAAAGLAGLLAGVPWAAWHFVGWPLPRHVPTWEQIKTVLSQPASTQLVVDTVACLCWLVWAAFVVDVVRCTVQLARQVARTRGGPVRPDPSVGGPVHALAAALVGAMVLALLGSRGTADVRRGPPVAPVAAVQPVAADAGPAVRFEIIGVLAESPAAVLSGVRPAAAPTTPAAEPGVVVRAPWKGVHDSLWRIADRELGDGARWPEIYQLNRGRLQPDGGRLLSPNLIYPGWRLHLPSAHSRAPERRTPPGSGHGGHPQHPSGPHRTVPPAGPSGPPTIPRPAPTPPTQPAPAPGRPPATGRPPAAPPPGPGLALPTGAFVSLGLATLIASAWLSAHAWRRRHEHEPGEDDERDFAPIVRALRLAHATADPPGGDPQEAVILTGEPVSDDAAVTGREARAIPTGATRPAAGVRDGRELAVDLAGHRGLGLIGTGAPAAARALLVALLARRHDPSTAQVEVLIPADTATAVLGPHVVGSARPSRLRVTTSLDTALDAAEVELLTRTRLSEAERLRRLGTLVLVATPEPHALRRLQAVLDNGSTLGIAAVLIGQWRPGATVRVRDDGTVAAASPDVADTMTEARLFTLPVDDTTALLDLLADADEPADHQEQTITDLADTDDNAEDADDHQRHGPHPRPPAAGLALADAAGSDAAEQPDRPQPSTAVRLAVADPAAPNDGRPDPAGTDLSQHRFAPDANDRSEPRPRDADVVESAPEGERDGQPTDAVDVTTGIEDASRPLAVTVLGGQRMYQQDGGQRRPVQTLAPRQWEVLAFLTLHRHGARREALATAIWPDARSDRPFNALHASMSQLRRALTAAIGGAGGDVIIHRGGTYQLNPELVSVDLWQLRDALHAAARDPDDGRRRLAALRRVADLYTGDFADGLTADWVVPPREALRREVLDALTALSQATSNDDPERTLGLLEQIRVLDRYNEAVYRDIIRLHARLRRHAAIPRTLALLTTTLAEIGQQPSRDTTALVEFLQRQSQSRPGSQRRGHAAI